MIYVHVPFCHRKCTYCAFYSQAESGKWKVENYVNALIEEMRLRCGEQDHPIKTVYFGGGTPSILPLRELERIVKALYDHFDLSQVEEVTLEANPEDLTDDYLHGLKELGFVNRLSIGIQSLNDDVLRLIGRRHTAAQAIAAVENAYTAGFHNLSVDFIYGLPSNFQFSIFNFQLVTHVSAYALAVEPGTALAVQAKQGRVVLPDDEEVVRQYAALRQQLEEAGFRQYEVSNYARPGFESRHNSRYWDRTPYLGLGPSAHSFDGKRRQWNSRMDKESVKWSVEGEEILTEADACNETVMTALRTMKGLNLNCLPEKYRSAVCEGMKKYLKCGWIVVEDGRYCPTSEGLLHADGMAAELFV